jgi:hypothetical protein
MQVRGPPPHRPLGRTLLLGGAVIGFAILGAFILYLVTTPLLWWREDYCRSLSLGLDNPAFCYLRVQKK